MRKLPCQRKHLLITDWLLWQKLEWGVIATVKRSERPIEIQKTNLSRGMVFQSLGDIKKLRLSIKAIELIVDNLVAPNNARANSARMHPEHEILTRKSPIPIRQLDP